MIKMKNCRQRKNRTPIYTFLVFLFILYLASWVLPVKAEDAKDMTLMIYMCGSDLESKYGSASDDIFEMENSGVDLSEVNVVLMAGGTSHWTNSFDDESTTILELQKNKIIDGAKMTKTLEVDAMDMAESDTLQFFLDYTFDHYYSREYSLIIWDHGGGPLIGVCKDSNSRQNFLELSEIKNALQESVTYHNRKLSWIGFDACLMASLETAYICSSFADYMIASEETEPVSGWDYQFLQYLGSGKDNLETARAIIDSYYDEDEHDLRLTLSCIDLEKIKDTCNQMDSFFSRLTQELSDESFPGFSRERLGAGGFGKDTRQPFYDLVDLYHLTQQYQDIIPEDAKAFQEAIDNAVVYSRSNVDYSHGLSIYSPYDNRDTYLKEWKDIHASLGVSQEYTDFLNKYSMFWLDDPFADWSTLSYQALPVTQQGVQPIELEMTEPQLEQFASAKILILEETLGQNSYYQVWEDSVEPDHTVLRYEYDYSALCVTDEDDRVISPPIEFIMKRDGTYDVFPLLENKSDLRRALEQLRFGNSDWDFLASTIRCHKTPEGDGLEIEDEFFGTSDDDSISSLQAPVQGTSAYYDTEEWPLLWFGLNPAKTLKRGEYGEILPFSDWPLDENGAWSNACLMDGEMMAYDEVFTLIDGKSDEDVRQIDLRKYGEVYRRDPWNLRFISGNHYKRNLYAQFVIEDVQGNEIATELIPIENPNLVSSTRVDGTFFQLYETTEHILLAHLQRIDIVKSEEEPGIYLYLKIYNTCDYPFQVVLDEIQLNGQVVLTSGTSLIEPHSQGNECIQIAPFFLKGLGGERMIQKIEFTPIIQLIEQNAYGYDVTTRYRGFPTEYDVNIDISEILEPGE